MSSNRRYRPINKIWADNEKLYFGDDKDASFYFDGTDFNFDFPTTTALNINDVDDVEWRGSAVNYGIRATQTSGAGNSTDNWIRIAKNTAAAGRGGCTVWISAEGGNAAPSDAKFHICQGWSSIAPSVTIEKWYPGSSVTQIRAGYDTTAGESWFDVKVSNVSDATFYVHVIADVASPPGWEAMWSEDVAAGSDSWDVNLTTHSMTWGCIGLNGGADANAVWFSSNLTSSGGGLYIGSRDAISDNARFHHDGTDFYTTFSNTGKWSILNSAGGEIIALEDTGGAGTAANPWMGYRDSGGTLLGSIGYLSGGNGFLYINNDVSNQSIEIDAHGTGNIVLRPNTGKVRIIDNGYTDYLDISHDGTTPRLDNSPDSDIEWDGLGSGGMLHLQKNDLTACGFQVWGTSAPYYGYWYSNGTTGTLAYTSHIYYRVPSSSSADHLFFPTSAGSDTAHDIRSYSTTTNEFWYWRSYDDITKLMCDEGTGSIELHRTQSCADDATITFDSERNHNIWIIWNTWDDSGAMIVATTGNSRTILANGANAQFGDGGTNPDVDGDVNCWISSNSVLSLKNRVGSTQSFTVVCITS